MFAAFRSERSDHRLTLEELLGLLVEDDIVGQDRARLLASVVTPSHRQNKHALAIIAEREWTSRKHGHQILTLDVLSQWLAARLGLPYRHIDPLEIDLRAATGQVSYAYAARFHILPLEVGPDHITIATAEPLVREWEKELAHVLGKRIERVFCNPVEVERYLLEFYSLTRSVAGATSREDELEHSPFHNLEQLTQLGQMGKLDANDQHVVNIVDWLLQYAFKQRASDIHLEPRREQGLVRLRIDGVMHQVYQIPSAVMTAVASRIKILGRTDVAEKRRPQDGRIKTRTPDGQVVELRLSTMPTAFGEKLVLRIFDPEVLVRSFADLGFVGPDVERWQALIGRPHGLVLVTGPTGSGKTTTLYSSLRHLARPEVNVCTVEDPIEMVDPAFNQMQTQSAIKLDFAAGVRTLMRQDPDIIMVGEIRDLETAEMAVQAALTGHLVLSTLHTNDAPSSIARLLDIGVAPHLLNATLAGVMAQRLVRTLCPHCKERTELDDAAWQALVAPWKVSRPTHVWRPVGCVECRNTGYRGRIGIHEILVVSPGVRALVTSSLDLTQLRQVAIQEGMVPLRINGAQKVAAGVTTADEVHKVTLAAAATD